MIVARGLSSAGSNAGPRRGWSVNRPSRSGPGAVTSRARSNAVGPRDVCRGLIPHENPPFRVRDLPPGWTPRGRVAGRRNAVSSPAAFGQVTILTAERGGLASCGGGGVRRPSLSLADRRSQGPPPRHGLPDMTLGYCYRLPRPPPPPHRMMVISFPSPPGSNRRGGMVRRSPRPDGSRIARALTPPSRTAPDL